MNIRETSLNLQKIYEEMSFTFDQFQKESNLSCSSGCGKCCTHPDIEATIVEMLPLALKILDEGGLETWHERAENLLEASCMLFEGDKDSGQGKCISYNERPSLCRMFGVAGYFDKNHQHSLSICKIIRENHSEKSVKNLTNLNKNRIPMMSEWATLATSLGSESMNVRMPINKAIKGALEKTALYAQYYQET